MEKAEAVSEGNTSKPDWEEINEQGGQKLIKFKTSNSMNNMLPSVKDAHEEAV